tara:strand:- start:1202 stop:1543 length:342 start_codon:yes stop_codon:yes gene_type:complete
MNKGEWGKLRAFFDLKTNDGFVIKGFKLVEGINGLFVGMPSAQGKDGEYYDTVFADKELRDELQQIALRAYGQESVTPTSNNPDTSIESDLGADTASTEAIKNEEFNDDDIPF